MLELLHSIDHRLDDDGGSTIGEQRVPKGIEVLNGVANAARRLGNG